MKKSLYTVLFLLSMGLFMVSCEKENADEIIIHDTTPELSSEGQYVGTWTRIIRGDSVAVTAPGSIFLKADTTYLEADTIYLETDTTYLETDTIANSYVTQVTFVSEDFSLNETSIANISFADKGFVYYNNSATNEIGAPFFGRINGDAVITASFELRIRVGPRFQYCTFSFEGQKVTETP